MKNLISLLVLVVLVLVCGCSSNGATSYYYFKTPPSQRAPAKPEGAQWYSYSAGRTTTETKIVSSPAVDRCGIVSGSKMPPSVPTKVRISTMEGPNGYSYNKSVGGTATATIIPQPDGTSVQHNVTQSWETESRVPNQTQLYPSNIRYAPEGPGGVQRLKDALKGK